MKTIFIHTPIALENNETKEYDRRQIGGDKMKKGLLFEALMVGAIVGTIGFVIMLCIFLLAHY